MESQLQALRLREIGFDEFARSTAGQWSALAYYLMRRWKVPAAVELEDVRQELMMACWRCVGEWEPGRGTTIEKYVVYKSIDGAKRWLHSQRSAYKRRDNSPSRHAMPFSALASGGEAVTDFVLTTLPEQHERVEQREAAELAAGRCRSDRERRCLFAVLECGSVEQAADLLYEDPEVRRLCRFGSRGDARRAIWRTAASIAA